MASKTKHGNPLTAVAYLRVSTEEQHLGIEAQRASIEAWAARAGVTVVGWHVDQGVSGAAPLEKRAGLMAAVDALAQHGAGVLVVAKRDRLARDVVLAALVERLVIREGARVASAAGEGTDGDGPADQMLRSMLDCFAQYERAIIRQRTTAALAVKKARGERVGAVPYGQAVGADGRTLVPCPEEQAVLECVLAWHQQGLSQRAIVAALAADGRCNRSGNPFTKTSVERMLAGE